MIVTEHTLVVKVCINIHWHFNDTILFETPEVRSLFEFVSCKHLEVGEYLDGPTFRLVGARQWLVNYCEENHTDDMLVSALRHCVIDDDLRIPVSWIGRVDPISLFA